MGVVVPHVDTAEEARAVAAAYRFPPIGTRSWGGPPFAYNFKPPSTAEAQAELNRDILVACMIETPEAVANVAAIAAVPGVDVLLIGTSDLTASMGIPGQIGHPDVQAAYAKVAAACATAGKVMGMGGVYDETWAAAYIKLGARFLLSGSDHNLLMAAAAARSQFLRGLQPG
jgi:2-keto-3-deoxy-L-rhamnonate aldolase RhmA